jgi:hypothetical protein
LKYTKNISTQPWYEEKNRTDCKIHIFGADPEDMLTDTSTFRISPGTVHKTEMILMHDNHNDDNVCGLRKKI